MRKSKLLLVLMALSVLFFVTAAALTLTETFANEVAAPFGINGYTTTGSGSGKVEPPGWCVEHGYFGAQYEEDLLYCKDCD